MRTIDENEIRGYVGDQSFQRGSPYARDGSIFAARCQGDTLKARCHGQSGGPYLVEATLGSAGIAGAGCSCPVGYDGRCKHVAALLLSFRQHPDDFVELEPTAAALERRSKQELIALITAMLRQEPELELLLAVPVAAAPGAKPLDPALYRRQVRRAFRGASGDWGASYGVAHEIQGVIAIADGFAERGDWRNAAVVYGAVAAEVLDAADEIHDEEGEIAATVAECGVGLARCLRGLQAPAERAPLLRSLFEIVQADLVAGGIGMDGDAQQALIEDTTPEERRSVAAWALAALPPQRAGAAYLNWTRQALGKFVIALEGDALDDERYLAIARAAGPTEGLVDRLLRLARLPAALQAAEQADDMDLPPIATKLVEHGHAPEAVALVERRKQGSTAPAGTVLRRWLRQQYEREGDLPAALAAARADFSAYPSQQGFAEVRRLAQPLGSWQKERAALLAEVRGRSGHELLVALYLDEGEVEAALAAWPKVAYRTGALRLRLADASEATHPEAAVALRQEQVETLIAGRNRGTYAEAAQVLLMLRATLTANGRQADWEAYLADLLSRHRALRALKDEMRQAGLPVA